MAMCKSAKGAILGGDGAGRVSALFRSVGVSLPQGGTPPGAVLENGALQASASRTRR
jgi:hypothetical protein